MKKPQVFVVAIALILLGSLYFLAPRSSNALKAPANNTTENQSVTNQSVIDGAKTNLSAEQKISLLSIENQLSRSKSTADSLTYTIKLAKFWADSANRLAPYLYYSYRNSVIHNTVWLNGTTSSYSYSSRSDVPILPMYLSFNSDRE